MEIEITWKEVLAFSALILAICLGCGGCQYLEALADKTKAEKVAIEKKGEE